MLTERLKAATHAHHVAAERTAVMRALTSGVMPLEAYRELLSNLHAIYEALEGAIARNRSNAACAAIDLVRLGRLASLRHDLDALHAMGWTGGATLQLASTEYVARLDELGARHPELLIAHAYVRYLGDLSGGQLLGRIVGQKMQAPIAFYEFGGSEPVARLARDFRQALDGLVLSDAQSAAIVDEAVGAFDRHVALFRELEGRARKCEESLDSPR